MVAQLHYDNVIADVINALGDDGMLIRNCEDTLWVYHEGAWGVMSMHQRSMIERIMYDAAADHTFPYAEKLPGLWRTLKSKGLLLAADRLDKQSLIACPNGTLDPMTGTLMEHDPQHFTTRRIAIEYEPRAKCPDWLTMLDRCMPDKSPETREAYVEFLQEFFGMALVGFNRWTPRELRKALILYGASGTAKTSGVADVLREFFVQGEVCAENVDQLSKDFGLASLASARALISDDAIGSRSKPDANVLKKLITGEPMTANRKYKDAQSFRFRGPVVFTTNNKPQIDDESDALFNRTVLLTFDYVFQQADMKLLKGMTPVAYLQSKNQFPGILNWALEGMTRARENGRYSAIAEANESSRVWRSESDPTFDFLMRYGQPESGVSCTVQLVSRMIKVYSDDEHAVKTSPKKAQARLKREVAKIIPGAKIKRDASGGDVIRGLRIKTEGALYERIARDRGLVPDGVKWAINVKDP